MKWSKFLNSGDEDYRVGDWRVIDDISGFKEWASDMVKTWDGYMTRADLALPRNEQDFLRGKKESSIPWARPEPDDTFGRGDGSDL